MYKNLKIKSFLNKTKSQYIPINSLETALKSCSANCPFSTFPYSIKSMNSADSLKKYNSGNCISLSLYLKKFIKKNYNLKSYLIPATIPKVFQKKGYLPICHVALAVPANKQKIYILDPAFYIKTPLVYDNSDYPKQSYMVNIYIDTLDPFMYTKKIQRSQKKICDYQVIPRNTKFLECYLDADDKWSYYLKEVRNPDDAITLFFINVRPDPWITILDDNWKRKIYIKMLPDRNVLIKKYDQLLHHGPVNEINRNTIYRISNDVERYMGNNLLSFLKNRKKKYSVKRKPRKKRKRRKTKKN